MEQIGITNYLKWTLKHRSMKRKKIIKAVNALKGIYVLTGEHGVFAIVGRIAGLAPKTIETYYYCDKLRPVKKNN